MELFEEQQHIFDIMKNTDSGVFIINGRAGTGKSFLTSSLCKEYVSQNRNVTATSPTHAAVWNLSYILGSDSRSIGLRTIHSFLGLREKELSDGTITFVPNNKYTPPEVDVLIIDEMSMVNKELTKLILQYYSEHEMLLIFVGDFNQLPPVGEKISVISRLNVTKFTLPVNRRCVTDSPILDASNKLIDEHFLPTQTVAKPESSYVVGDFIPELMSIVDVYKKTNTANFRVLAWTNKAVDFWNKRIRQRLYETPTPDDYYIGEILIMRNSYSKEGMVILQNNVLLVVKDVTPIKINISDYEINGWALNVAVKSMYIGERSLVINVVSSKDKHIIDSIVNTLSDAIRKTDDIHKKKTYSVYRRKIFDLFANVGYAYATTVHKAQGAGFENVFIDGKNIRRNTNYSEMYSMLYTAITRGIRNVYMDV